MTSPIGLSNQPFYVREGNKDWAVRQESYRHDQALYSIGEYCLFLLMWDVEDFQAGYVGRCQRCFAGDDKAARTGAVYLQPTQNKCPYCFGTSFDGGVRAKIVRPTMITDSDDDEKPSAKGAIHTQNISIETTSDFRYRTGDFMVRLDGSRWRLGTPTRTTLRTGFEHPTQEDNSIGYSQGGGSLEDLTSVAYLIPPSENQIEEFLKSPERYPTAF